MFVKETKVKRSGREYSYLQLVDGYRDEHGKVRHRVVANLGRKDALKDSGQLEALAGSFARLDPPMTGTRRSVGPLLVVEHFLRELQVKEIVDGGLPRSARSILSVGEVVCALIASRLCSPSPLYDVAGWASGAAVHELLGIPPALLNDDRLGRALETFAVYAEHLRSVVAARAIERFGVDAGRLHVDLTTVRVAGAYEDSALISKGWGADRRVARQVRSLQACTADGTVLYSRPDPGNASELTLVGASLERLLKLSGPGLLIVCDSAIGQPKTLAEIHQAGVRFIVPLRASAGFRERFLKDAGHRALRPVKYVPEREARLPTAARTRFKGVLRDWEIPTQRRAASEAAGRVHPLLRGSDPGRPGPRACARQGRGRAGPRPQRSRRPLLQDPPAGRTPNRADPRPQHHRAHRRECEDPQREAGPGLATQPGRDQPGSGARRDLRPRDEHPRPGHRRTAPTALQRPADRRAPPPRPQTDPQSPPDLPTQRRPRLRATEHRRDLTTDLRPHRSANPSRAR